MTESRCRLDAWLWYARLTKSRSLGAGLCHEGAVRLGDRPVKPAHPVRPGDRITLDLRGWRRQVEVLALAVRRGPAIEAQALYREIEPPLRILGPESPWPNLFDGDPPEM